MANIKLEDDGDNMFLDPDCVSDHFDVSHSFRVSLVSTTNSLVLPLNSMKMLNGRKTSQISTLCFVLVRI